MKKILMIVLVFSLLLVSCGNGNAPDYLQSIYEIESLAKGIAVEEEVPREVTITVLGQELNLEYAMTYRAIFDDFVYHRYKIAGFEDGFADLREDGSVYSLYYPIATVNIEENATPEEVHAQIGPALLPWIDLSKYEYVDMPQQKDANCAFGSYEFRYYNMIDGYRPDHVEVRVHDNGVIDQVEVYNLGADLTVLNIDPEFEETVLDMKLKEIYTTEKTQYETFVPFAPPYLRWFNGEVHVFYTLEAKFSYRAEQIIYSEVKLVLVPVDLLTGTQGP